MRRSWDHSLHAPLLSRSLLGSESDDANWYGVEENKLSTDKTRALSDPMDLDSESTVTDQKAFKTETLYLQRQVETEAKTNATVVGELLASRLHTQSPFGKLSLLLMVCSSLLIIAKTSSSP